MGNSSSCPIETMPADPVPFFSHGNINFKAHDVGWIVCIFFSGITSVASGWLIFKHLEFYTNPGQQRYIVRILFMPPIYAIVSFCSYFWWAQAIYFQLLRDCYEAVVIGSFFYLLLAYLSAPLLDPSESAEAHYRYADEDRDWDPEDDLDVSILSKEGPNFLKTRKRKPAFVTYPIHDPTPKATKADRDAALRAVFRDFKLNKWMWPMGWWKYRPDTGLNFLLVMKWSILQYVVVRPVSTAVAVATQAFNLYCRASWSPAYSHLWTTVAIGASVTIAMYAILQLYISLKKELAAYHPILKFFAVKSVVFLTFWQESFLSVLVWFGAIKPSQYWSAAEIQVGIGALLECLEMAIFSFMHIKAFTYVVYRPPLPDAKTRQFAKTSKLKALRHVLDFRDLIRELGTSTTLASYAIKGRDFYTDRRGDLDEVMGIKGSRRDTMGSKPHGAQKQWKGYDVELERDLQRIKEHEEDRECDKEDHLKLSYIDGGQGSIVHPRSISYKLFDTSVFPTEQADRSGSRYLFDPDGTPRNPHSLEPGLIQDTRRPLLEDYDERYAYLSQQGANQIKHPREVAKEAILPKISAGSPLENSDLENLELRETPRGVAEGKVLSSYLRGGLKDSGAPLQTNSNLVQGPIPGRAVELKMPELLGRSRDPMSSQSSPSRFFNAIEEPPSPNPHRSHVPINLPSPAFAAGYRDRVIR